MLNKLSTFFGLFSRRNKKYAYICMTSLGLQKSVHSAHLLLQVVGMKKAALKIFRLVEFNVF